MLRRLGLAAATALTLSLPAFAEAVTDFRLANGLEVVVIEDHRAPVVTHMVWYRVGAADEPPGHSGIAHFLEHLMFKGTDELKPGEFSATVEAQGGDDNAFTSWDYTAYFQRVAADRLDLMMKMEADRMRDLQMSEDDVKTERQVVLEERSQRTDSDPDAIFGEQRRAAQYLNHPYGIPIIGWRHEIEQLDREDAFSFYRTYYAPNNAILVVAGDVTPDEVKRLAETHYGALEPTENLPPRLRPQEPPQLAERRLTFTDPRVAQPYVARSYLAPARESGAQEKAAALTILAELLGGSPTTSLLASALQFGEAPKAVWSQAYYDGSALDSGSFSVAVVPVPGVSLQAAEEAMDAVIADFLKTGPDPEDFARIKTQLRAHDIYSRDNVDGLARRYGAALTTGLTVEDVERWPEVLQAVTPEEVVATAREVFDRRRAVTGWLEQEEEESQ
ncbi:insulinase family protein [Cereibacter sphaeroides]|uniref:M16 family metallopeptidase n=1 Tax=Cereibacter sphaeroides TaxID=1063 RepID=UPI001F47810E|nr:pitrilysin family protein [Cereibacter sphaeroides]MCE6958598.1 insulinase family protein [Cereibacter sphaeroides]MCE6968969.1 insulinase family protein [Cereibacter sphaeroides]MCE6972359.1 insulinase family protein [Cereibacter sphaeroides]